MHVHVLFDAYKIMLQRLYFSVGFTTVNFEH